MWLEKSSNPTFASSLTKILPFFWGASYSLSFFWKRASCLGRNTFGGGRGSKTKLQRSREKHCPELVFPCGFLFAQPLLFASPCTNRLNTWIMPSSGLEYTYITYPFLTNQPDTFLCGETVPKQTLSAHLISRFVGSAWQPCYILFNNREQQPWLGQA